MNKLTFFKTAASLCAIGALGLAAAPMAQAFEVEFKNENTRYKDDQVYVMFQDVQGGNVRSKTAYTWAQLPKPVRVERASGRIWISLGEPVQPQYGPNFASSSLPNYKTRWDKIEWTIDGSPTQCANLSSADFFSIPLKLSGGQTDDGKTELSWKESTASVFNKLKAAAGNINSDPVIPGNGPAGIVRVISPSTTANPSTYTSYKPYIDAVKGKTTKVKGHFYGNPQTDFEYDATIDQIGNLVMIGKGKSAGHSIRVEANDLPVQGLYKCDPQFSVDNQPGWNFAKNDVYCAALRDVLAGFNFGFVGSPVTNPHTGKPFGDSSTDTWVNTKSDYAYSGAQPNNPTFYNQYANVIARASDSYGFPFGDTFVHKPLMNLRSGKLTVTVQND
jgi:Beta-1,3-glucanase